MSRGLVWYEKSDTFPAEYTITGMNMPFDENKYLPDKDLPQGWVVEGELIPPQCLPHPFISEDNFEPFADYYKLDVGEFEKEPGKFFGKPIKDLSYLPDSWAVKVIASLDTCGSDADKPVVQEDGSVLSGEMPDAEGYKILGRLDQQECAKLIPNYPVKPEICFAINVTEYTDGTMRQYDNNYIYGLIKEKDKNYILPLLSLGSKDDWRHSEKKSSQYYPLPSLSRESSNEPTDQETKLSSCTLTNKEFCGKWNDNGFEVLGVGERVFYDGYSPCKVMKEGNFEDGRPFSLLKCMEPSEPDMPQENLSGSSWPTGLMITYYPGSDWRTEKEPVAFVSIFGNRIYDTNLLKNPCFSDKSIERESCRNSSFISFAGTPVRKSQADAVRIPVSVAKAGDKAAHLPCTLKNTEFCGIWEDNDGFHVAATGAWIIYGRYSPCTVMKEGKFEDGRPFSLLKCTAPDDLHPAGYLFTYYPTKNWRNDQGKHAQLYDYGKYGVPEISCFSDKKEERDACNIQELMHAGSRIPIYKQ